MATTKPEIIISAVIVLSLVLLFITEYTTAVIYDSSRKVVLIAMISVATLICSVICCLHIRHAPNLRWKMLIVGVFLSSTGAVLCLCMLLNPPNLDFEFNLMFGIDTTGLALFWLMSFTSDKIIISALTLFVSSLFLLYVRIVNQAEPQFHYIILSILSLVMCLLLLLICFKHFSNHWRKVAAIALIFAAVIIVAAHFIGIFSDVLFFSIASIDACSAFLLYLWMYAQKARHNEMLEDDQYNFHEIETLPKRFAIKDLEIATRNFEMPIGEGGSGAVFKGTLDDGSIIAVKRIKGQASGETEFRTEITTIASLQHMNLVHLLGYCLLTGGDRYLIYPLFENGSLDVWLFKDDEKRRHLTWRYRYGIATDVAKALAYLHHECHHRVLHLDIKPANILLDGSFRALVSDFGISKSIGKDESSVMTRARGTIGYLPPEMLVPNAISTKSDVYSYGMVLLELVGGRRNFMTVADLESQQTLRSYFPKIVREKMMEGKLMEAVDPLLEQEKIRKEEVEVLIKVALWCIQENPALRPSASKIVDMLEGRTPVSPPPESPMFVVNFLDTGSEAMSCKQAQDMEATGTISISIMSGR